MGGGYNDYYILEKLLKKNFSIDNKETLHKGPKIKNYLEEFIRNISLLNKKV